MLNPKSFALAGAILWGGALFILTLIAVFTTMWVDFLNIVSALYPGYSITLVGSVIGFVYGFIDAGVACYLFAWIYNYLEKKL